MFQSKSKKSKSKPNATAAGGAQVPQNARLNFYVLLRAPLQCVKIKEIKFKNQMQVGQREPPISVHSKPGCTMCPGSPVAFRTMRSCPLPTGRGVLYVDTEQVGFLRLRSLPPHKQNNSNQIENFYNDAVQIENTEKRNIDKQVQSSCSSCRQRRRSCSSC